MVRGNSSDTQLSRILQLLPLATVDEGIALEELASRLGVTRGDVLRDLDQLTARSFYRPAGDADDVTVLVDGDRVEVWTTGEFRRPARLSPLESAALALGLRLLAAQNGTADGDDAEGSAYRSVAAKIEKNLALPAPEAAAGWIEVAAGAQAPGRAHSILLDSARDRRRCRIEYLRPAATAPEVREFDPYVLLVANGHWYAVGHCHSRGAVRVFRMDRVLHAEQMSSPFTVPEGFSPAEYVSNGRVYRSEDFQEVTIRYSPRISRWISEKGPCRRLEDGSVELSFAVSDPDWAIRHVLEHAPEAVIVSPPELRDRVVEVLARVTSRGAPQSA